MLAVIQRVIHSDVSINGSIVGQINQGIMALVAIEKDDTPQHGAKLLEKILSYRIFADANDRMNLSLRDVDGGLLLIPQFTLAADTNSGNRPSFSPAAPPEQGNALFQTLKQQAQATYPKVAFGEFGADMKVNLLNDGPVTFILKVNKL